jgi:hypothetical protein
MSDFSALKRNRNAFDSLKKAMETPSSTAEAGSKDDTRFWQPEVDKAGNGMAVIRFLPAPAADGDDALPWVRVFNHGFQGPGGWYIENSLTTLNQKDPVSEYNSILWNSGIEANKEIARKQKRRLTYISNILVVSDPKNPENEGQIKLYKYGKKIFDKISEAMNPEFADETPLNPFDFWEGANFKIKIRQVEGYRNYDKSEFDSITPVDSDDDKLEALWKKEYSLKEFLEPKQFKSYDTLKAKMDKVLGLDGVAPVKTKAEDTILNTAKSAPSLNENDEELDYFRSLAED